MPRYIPQAAEDKGLSKREPGTALMSSISALSTGQGSVAQEGWLQLSCRPSLGRDSGDKALGAGLGPQLARNSILQQLSKGAGVSFEGCQAAPGSSLSAAYQQQEGQVR